jgi:hypothetical protein
MIGRVLEKLIEQNLDIEPEMEPFVKEILFL